MAENDKNTRFDEIWSVFVDYTGFAETLKRRRSSIPAKKGCFFETTFLNKKAFLKQTSIYYRQTSDE